MEFKYLEKAEFDALTPQQQESYAKSKREHEAKEAEEKAKGIVSEVTKNLVSKEELTKLDTRLKTALEEIEVLKENGGSKMVEKSLVDEIKENKEDLKSIIKGTSNKEVVVKGTVLRSTVAGNQQAVELTDIGQLAHSKLTAYDIFRRIPVTGSNHNGVIRYYDWDEATKVRASAMVAEGTAFPESTAAWATYTIDIKKIGDTLPVSEEFFEDEAMFASELNMFLDTNVKIKRNEQIVNGDGLGENLTGIFASVDAYTPVASGIQDASIYDLMVKVSESITSVGGSKYSPDFALMNISDINKMKLKKDANNNYIIPPFVSRDGKQVDTIIVLEENAVTPNTMVLGDRRYTRIYEIAGVTLSRGLVNAQFTSDLETLKARTRLAFLIRNADKGGFKKVTDISLALTTLATP